MDLFMVFLGKYIRKYFRNKKNEQYMYIIILVKKILTLCKIFWKRITIYLNSKAMFLINKLMRSNIKKDFKNLYPTIMKRNIGIWLIILNTLIHDEQLEEHGK